MIHILSRTLWLILFAGLTACGDSGNHPESVTIGNTDSVLSENRMVVLMADVHIAEAAITIALNQGRETKALSRELYDGIFRKHGITRADYDQSLRHYNQHPQQFTKMYTRVISILKDQEQRFAAEKGSVTGNKLPRP